MRHNILTALTALAICSSTLGNFDIDKVTPADFTGVAGKVTDSKGNPKDGKNQPTSLRYMKEPEDRRERTGASP